MTFDAVDTVDANRRPSTTCTWSSRVRHQSRAPLYMQWSRGRPSA